MFEIRNGLRTSFGIVGGGGGRVGSLRNAHPSSVSRAASSYAIPVGAHETPRFVLGAHRVGLWAPRVVLGRPKSLSGAGEILSRGAG